ncbi:MAG: F0F1 ATP synthase subunit A [Ardenticatenales bacterium]|nr:F0F1 ATP synthase subunit A [Ardenticatenales bacterium]
MGRLLNPKVLGALFIFALAVYISRTYVSVPLPSIQLPAEPIHLGPLTLPNTFIATLLTDITVLLLAFAATRKLSLVPSGLQNILEMAIEGFYNLTEDIAGHNAAKFFPWVMTIFLMVLISNWWELVPGFDAIGWMESHPGMTHYETRQVFPGLKTLVNEGAYTPTGGHGEEAAEGEHEDATETEAGEHTEEAAGEHAAGLPKNEAGNEVAVLVPFLRAAATDLNFTLALSLISMFMVQYYGVQALGLGYFSKFLNLKGGVMGFFVGVIETISEFAKVLSFSFRLFGNIFGGQVLLFVMAYLVPWLLPVPFYGLELFVGFIQAFVFAMLTLVFFAVAVISHDDHH